jgi:Zn-dependent protease with chaperone function
MIRPSEFIHPEDAAALRQLESIPGFPALVKKVMALGLEQLYYGLNMATAIRLSPTQLPQLYNHLPPICAQLGIPEPEFYLQMDPVPNAWTFGDTKIYITITSGLVDLLNDVELDSVIAHECGHILCRHVLYHNIAQILRTGADALGLLGSFTAPVKYAMLYWQRKSELSCDRCAAVVTSPEVVARAMARIAGGPKSITANLNMREWAQQADLYDQIRNENLWNKTLQISAVLEQSHPFSAVRVREVLKWGGSQQYRNLTLTNHTIGTGMKCPQCGSVVDPEWRFCQSCGAKLK